MIARFIDRVFGIDARSLAAFRVAVGVILLIDLSIRAGSIVEHYSDAGLLPRPQWIEAAGRTWVWSLHAMNGLPAFQAMLFAIAAVAAAALVIGYRTRAACVISWVLLASLQQRNEILLNGGDALLRVFLFWAMFLPLGRRWSIDAWLARRTIDPSPAAPPPTVLSVASACIVIQFLGMYVVTGLFKLNDAWRTGDALRRSFSFDMYVKPAGLAMLENEAMLRTITMAVPWIEIVLPLLCLLPVLTRWWRGIAIVVFVGLHIGIELTLTTGLFPWVCMAGWLLLVPGAWWDAARLGRAMDGAKESHEGAREPRPRRPAGGYIVDGVLVFLMAYVVLWNVTALREKFDSAPATFESHRWLGELTTLKQTWNMFTDPPLDTGWYVVTGHNGFGDEIDLLTGAAVKDAQARGEIVKPTAIYRHFPDHRWRKIMTEWMGDGRKSRWPVLARALGQRWNRTHDETQRVRDVALVFMREKTPKPGEEATPVVRVVMARVVLEEE